jgi:DNA-binding MarR family transcriptional regulator
VRVGAPFNPYKVFQGVFAPYWILEHKGIGAGAKLCYIRLLGFAGKDARCYPSLETLGKSLGVSDRQVRDYIKELERAGLITTEQRGLRRTNVYLFLWTAELEKLNCWVDSTDDPDDSSEGRFGHRLARTGLPVLTGTIVPLWIGTVLPLLTGTLLPVLTGSILPLL